MLDCVQFIRDIHAARKGKGARPIISFEFFPPKTEEGERALFDKALPGLLRLRPDFCSVTYGAGGTTREKTLDISDRIQRQFKLPTMSHLTCVGSDRKQIHAYTERARQLGIRNLLALRGDPPGGVGHFQKTEGGFEFSWQLVEFLRELNEFSIGTAGFPEGHIACKEGKQVDWKHLKTKIDHGADFVITQLFFDNQDFFEFRAFLDQLGVTVPICPGILPIVSGPQLKRFSALCGAKVPKQLDETLTKLGDNEAAVTAFGVDYATRQCEELINAGVPGLHFYTLNRSQAATTILTRLSLV